MDKGRLRLLQQHQIILHSKIIRLQRGSTNTQRRRGCSTIFFIYHRVLFVLHFLLRVDSKDTSASTWIFSEVSASDRHHSADGIEVEERHQASYKQDEDEARHPNVVVELCLPLSTYSSLQLLTLVTGE